MRTFLSRKVFQKFSSFLVFLDVFFRSGNFVTPILGPVISSPPPSAWKRRKIYFFTSYNLSCWIEMQIPCFMMSRIATPSWWILSNHLDFSNRNFVTKLPNPGSQKLLTINYLLMREFCLRKLFNWQFVFTKIWYNRKQPNKARPIFLSCRDEIMLRDEITGPDGILLVW